MLALCRKAHLGAGERDILRELIASHLPMDPADQLHKKTQLRKWREHHTETAKVAGAKRGALMKLYPLPHGTSCPLEFHTP